METEEATTLATGIPFSGLQPVLSEATLAVLERLCFSRTTPVQAQTIPLFLSHKDVAVQAITGSGKTLAFVIPVIEILRKVKPPLKKHQVGAVIISPTRELASQIFSVAQPFVASVENMSCALLVGGTSVPEDVSTLTNEGANVLIGTPGRLDDIFERAKSLDLRALEVLILDEADRLLDLGFQRQLSSVLTRLPRQRRTGLFSATQTEAVEELARSGMRNPVSVQVDTEEGKKGDPGWLSTPLGLTIEFTVCPMDERPSQVVSFLTANKSMKVILYVLTCACADFWGSALPLLNELEGQEIIVLHGKMKQAARQAALAKFASLPAGILVCTDVAARGLDIPGVDYVVQMDAPQDPKSFLHRCGRTARMGRTGSALVFLTPQEDSYVEFQKMRGVPMAERQKSEAAADITPQLQQAAMSERSLMEKGLRAHVSYFRGYKEHHCHFIFQWRELQLGRLGMGMGLLHLPSMPELRRRPALGEGFVSPDLGGKSLDSIPYRDKLREKQRKKNLKKRKASEAVAADKKVARDKDLEQRENAADVAEEEVAEVVEDEDSEDDDMESDYRLLKRLKKGAITMDALHVEPLRPWLVFWMPPPGSTPLQVTHSTHLALRVCTSDCNHFSAQ